MSRTERLAAWSTAALLAVAVASCGDNSTVDAPSSTRGNATDRAFAAAMVPHHEGAIDMAQLARMHAERGAVKEMAADVIRAQKAEIATLRKVERQLVAAGVETGDLGLDEHTMGMSGDLTRLRSANPFDRAFIDAMVPHHEGAVRMAEVQLDKGENVTLRRIAQDIVDAQRQEIEQMRAWREAWFGSSDVPMQGGHDGHDM